MSSCGSNPANEDTVSDFDQNSNIRCDSPVLSRIASSASVSSIASFPEYNLESDLLPSDVKNKLSELVKTKGPDLLQACRNFDRRSTNKIPKTQLRQVLRTFCFPITAAYYDALCNEIQPNSVGKINYHDFFASIAGLKKIPITRTREKISDKLPVDEVELRIKEKIKTRLRDVIRSFWLFDINKDGLIQKSELRRIIRNYCFDLSDDLYDDLWKCYDPKGIGVIRYRDFLVKLGINADRYKKYMPVETAASSLCWTDDKTNDYMRDKRAEQRCRRAAVEKRDDPLIQGLPMEEILIIFVNRLQRRRELLKNTFNLFDTEKNGEITISDFRGVINYFVMPMSTGLYDRVMKKLEIEMPPDTKLYYPDFLDKFCDPSTKTELLNERDSKKLDCAPVVQRIKNRVLNPDARLRSVFTKINTDNEWQITRPELKKAVEIGLDFKLSDDEFKELTTLLDPGNTNIINCSDFLKLFSGPCDGDCLKGQEMDPYSEIPDKEKYSQLKGKKLKSKLKHHLNKNVLNIEKAVLICDADQSGFIMPDRLQDILSNYCFPLSNEQFEELISDLKIYGEKLNYHEFLELYKKKPDDDTNKWVSMIDKLVTYKSRCPPELPVDEIEELLCDCVRSRKTVMLKDFKALDVCNVGVACKDDARNVLNKFAFRLNDKQFHELWKKFPCNKYDQLLYDEFLEEYSTPTVQNGNKQTDDTHSLKSDKMSEAGSSDSVRIQKEISKTSDSSKRGKSHKSLKDIPAATKLSENRKTAKEILYAKAPHLIKVFDSMEAAIIRNFRTIRYHLRRADPKVTGLVDFTVLKSILAKSDIYFTKEEEFHILEYFDTHLIGKINYRDFLRIFVWYA